MGFRGSFLSLLFALEEHGSGYDKHPLLIHMPGYNEDSIRETPVLELYAAGTRFRKALDTLIRQAGAGRALPEEVDAFLAGNRTLEEADAWLGRPALRPAAGLAALLEASGPVLLVEALAERSSTLAAQVPGAAEAQVLWDYLRKLLAIDEQWFAFASGTPDPPGKALPPILNALGAWILCMEYVHDLRRPPGQAPLLPLKALSPALVKTATRLVGDLRERHPAAYERVADQVSLLLYSELEAMTAEDLGQIDTFREEDDKVLQAAIAALKAQRWSAAVAWCKERLGGRSFWVGRDQMRRREWELVAEAAAFGALVAEHPRPLGEARDHLEALAAYAGPGALVDRAHRRFEQQRALRFEPQLPNYGALTEVVGILRRVHRDWADQLSRDFNRVCKAVGFLPPSELRQRTLFRAGGPSVDAGGREGGGLHDRCLSLRDGGRAVRGAEGHAGSAAVDLKPRLAELPTITAVGMNALAPVARGERLTVAGEFQGFRRGSSPSNSPDTRCRAMGASAAGGVCLRLELADRVRANLPGGEGDQGPPAHRGRHQGDRRRGRGQRRAAHLRVDPAPDQGRLAPPASSRA